MSGARIVRAAHSALVGALRCIEPVEDRSRLAVADDFVAQSGLQPRHFATALQALDVVLNSAEVSNADIKGMLNRIDAWQFESPFGSDAKAARRHLEACRKAIAEWLVVK